MKPIGKIIHKYRVAAGLSFEEVSRRCGITRNYLSVLENGQASPTISKLEEVCKGLGISMLELIGAYCDVPSVIKGDVTKVISKKNNEMHELFDDLKPKDQAVVLKIIKCLQKDQS